MYNTFARFPGPCYFPNGGGRPDPTPLFYFWRRRDDSNCLIY